MDNEQEPKPGLMSVPVKVRQIIINILAHTPSDPPASPSVSQQDYRLLKPDNQSFGMKGVWQRPPINPVLNMMLVNHQLHEEVNFCLEAVPQRYHLDVMNIKTYGLWTTWSISKMPKQQYIETVSCTFRLFEPTPDLDDRFTDSVSFKAVVAGRQGASGHFMPSWRASLNTALDIVLGTPTSHVLSSEPYVTQPEAMFLQRYMRWQGTRGDRTAEEALAGLLISDTAGFFGNSSLIAWCYGSTAKIARRLMLSKSAKLTNLTSSSIVPQLLLDWKERGTGGGTRSGCWNNAKWLGTGKKWTTSAL
ncbi:hypothetical protein V8F06_003986 [Rhypophila decipiens]